MERAVDRHGRPLIRYRDSGGNVRYRSEEEQCDFCTYETPTWEYPAALMEIVGHPAINTSDDEWAACAECHRLIEAHDVEGLLARIIKLQRRIVFELRVEGMNAVTPDDFEAHVRRNVLRFMDARTGPARPWVPPESHG